MKKEGRAGKREALAIARAETAEAALKAERKLRFQFEEKVKAQLMGPQSLVPTVFFPALGEVAVRKDALHLHAEIAEAALHAGAASLTEMKGDLDWKTLQVKVQTGLVAEERAKLAGVTGVLHEVRRALRTRHGRRSWPRLASRRRCQLCMPKPQSALS